ncbi:MAG: ergothioneine biosynthesis protein EgtB [Proteobacteria bacterium]|nr:ergothioneine biosynthesis protein EgtB [Pseudomonadota bacterium]
MPLLTRFRHTRATTVGLCERLEAEDFVVQSMPDASPAKWHLAHTAWFFEEFLLGHFRSDYQCFEPRYGLLFNSYYKGVGQAFTRAERGLLSRPTVRDVMDYRQHVDSAMEELLARRGDDAEMQRLAELGCHHEQQHQELLLTDIKHAFSLNPLRPAYQDQRPPSLATAAMPLRFAEFAGGVVPVGHAGSEFSFDNETPRHQVLLQPFALGKRLVTNAEYRDFVTAGGYRDPAHWLADGWAVVESAAAGDSLSQMFGDVWEWTQSPYSPYPRFKSWSGRIAEYNGKFMANQFVLRGGSCVTPRNHIRATYRNFFPPNARWQFAGLRLAKDC